MVCAVLLVGLGVWWHYEELVIAGTGIGAVVIGATWMARRPLRASVERRVGAIRVPRGDPVNVVYRVRNASRFRTGRATVIDRCDGEECRVPLESVDAESAVDFFGNILTFRRGVFAVGPFEIERIDPFWLAVGSRRDKAVGQVTVHPKVYRLLGPQGAVRVVDSESVLRRASADPMSGFVSMREYVPGDDPRLIHWPTTARTGTLMVRETVEVRRPEFTVVVDTAQHVGTAEDFEEIVDVAATLASHAVQSGLDVVVRTTDDANPGLPTPLRSEGAVLDFLTPVQQTDREHSYSIAALFAGGLDHTSVVLVSGPDGPSSRFADLDRAVVIRIGDGATGTSGIAVAAQDAAEFVTRWKSWDQ